MVNRRAVFYAGIVSGSIVVPRLDTSGLIRVRKTNPNVDRDIVKSCGWVIELGGGLVERETVLEDDSADDIG